MKRAMMASAHLNPSPATTQLGSHLTSRIDNTMLRELRSDPENDTNWEKSRNRTSRAVQSGHWVKVLPTPLPTPRLVAHSQAMAEELSLNKVGATRNTGPPL